MMDPDGPPDGSQAMRARAGSFDPHHLRVTPTAS